jgi:DNA-binding MurR/RpiR family transcriptional regulator
MGMCGFFREETVVLLERLQERSGFTKTELRIAQYLLEHGLEVKDASVDELAELTQTSSASIVRLCKKLGMSGYRDFRIQFVSEYEKSSHASMVDANMPFSKGDSYEQIAWRLGNLAANAINNAITSFDYRQLERVVDKLEHADVINVFTVGTSIPAALDFKTKLMRMGRQINVDQDVMLQRAYALSATRQSFNLLISQSGETEIIVSYAKILASRGCYTMALTANRASRLAGICTEVIATNISESSSFKTKIETFASFDATHFVLDCLYCWLFQKQFDRNLSHSRMSDRILSEYTIDTI